MKNQRKYFVFNKEADFRRGCFYNTDCTTSGLRIADLEESTEAVFYSRILDSREKETLWHRIVIKSKSFGDASIRFTFYASDKGTASTSYGELTLKEIVTSTEMSQEMKDSYLNSCIVKVAFNPVDMLLYEAKGRYLWFKVELFAQGEESPEISHIKIYIQNDSWLEYLPEIYHSRNTQTETSFLNRYLSIFQSVYDDMEEKLDSVAAYFDPAAASDEVLQWLAGWIDVDDVYIWSQEKLRYLVSNGIQLYKGRGTRKAIADMIEIYTGQKPYIIEQYHIEVSRDNDKTFGLMQQLYGEHAYQFTVVVNEECAATPKAYKTLLKIVESAKPAHMEANVVVLKPYIFLNKYSYLGMNSVLGKYNSANLEGFSALQFTGILSEIG